MRADRIRLRARGAQLVLLGEGQVAEVVQPACGCGRLEPGSAELVTVEPGAVEQVLKLAAIARLVGGTLLGPRPSFDLRLEHHRATSSVFSYAMALSP